MFQSSLRDFSGADGYPGLRLGLFSARPVQTRFGKRLGSATTLYGTVAISFVIPSEPGFPTSQLPLAPLMWFSLKRTTCSNRSRNSRLEIRGSRGICSFPPPATNPQTQQPKILPILIPQPNPTSSANPLLRESLHWKNSPRQIQTAGGASNPQSQ